ncbi:MAG: hypothetical protein HYZ20_21365 [Burkholderiales bacterium]|nr:hypothetical protein [Burkholderiales bacterium]
MRPLRLIPFATLAASALLGFASLGGAPAQAQSGATGALGKGTGPIMTREELRACLKGQDDLNRRREQLQAESKWLDEEKVAIQAEQQALQGSRGSIQDVNAKVQAVNARRAEVAARIDDWNKRWEEFEGGNRKGPIAERQRKKLLDEQRELARENEVIDAEQAQVALPKDEVAGFNQRASALEQRVKAWNERNARAADTSTKLGDERELWTIECGNRRYLTDDEKAIREGR